MKKLIALFILLIFVVTLLFGCSAKTAEISEEQPLINEDGIVVYNWGEYISNGDDDTLDVIKDFTEKTGIKVNYQTFASNEELYTKMKSGAAVYDVIIPSDYMISKMISENMLSELNFDNIPNYKYIDAELTKKFDYDPEHKFSVPYTWGRVALLYNKNIVKDKIDSWSALWDSKYDNKILMFDNSRDAFGIAQKLLGYSFNSTNEEEWKKAAELLKEQKPLVRSYVMDQIFPMMSSGEAALAPYYIGDALIIMDQNEDVEFVVPKEGTNLFVDAMCVPSNSKNKEAAEAFINYMCSYEPAMANAEYICYSSPHVDVMKDHKDYLREEYGDWAVEAIYPQELGKCEVFLNLDSKTGKLQTDLWLEVRAGSNYTRSVVCVCSVMGVIIFSIVFVKIKKHKKDKFIYS